MLKITIEGERAEGKTTLAIVIHHRLVEAGYRITKVDDLNTSDHVKQGCVDITLLKEKEVELIVYNP